MSCQVASSSPLAPKPLLRFQSPWRILLGASLGLRLRLRIHTIACLQPGPAVQAKMLDLAVRLILHHLGKMQQHTVKQMLHHILLTAIGKAKLPTARKMHTAAMSTLSSSSRNRLVLVANRAEFCLIFGIAYMCDKRRSHCQCV